jgi:bifunctional UDP-N-acetylglucosamine pyrophosphorylase/glucosamine-1-phosphate N-acetyltransferase
MKPFPIILAAGKGTRMRSNLPKVLHSVGGKPMLQHVIDACKTLGADRLAIIYGHGGDHVQATINDEAVQWVEQAEQKGTGHAVAQANAVINDDDHVVIAYGDVPLIEAETLRQLLQTLQQADLGVLTTMLDDPTGYGRIVRNNAGKVVRIVEEKDADEATRQINEVNTGFIAAKGKDLKRWLANLSDDNAQGEYYLTDCIEMAAKEGQVDAVVCANPIEVTGVNNRIQQAQLERAYQWKQVEALMIEGATLADPARVDIRGELTVGQDVFIDVNTVFIGHVELGDNVTIESGCVITNSQIAANSRIKANSVLEKARIGKNVDVGPFARIRPEADIRDNAKIGNFVEIKKSVIGQGSKVSHLSYIGDTIMGSNVNVGAGTITCNYDGVNKHITEIGDNVFIGSTSQLVAPVKVENNATIGAGSTITKDVPEGELTLARPKQVTLAGWKRPVKNK